MKTNNTEWFRVWHDEIKKIEVFKETKDFVWIVDGGGQKKLSYYRSYFKTFDESKLFLLNKKETKLRDAERMLAEARRELQKIKNIQAKAVK